MADEIQVIKFAGVALRNTANKGEVGYLDINEQGGKIIRLAVAHQGLAGLRAQIEALEVETAEARRKAGPSPGPVPQYARETDHISAEADPALGVVVLHLRHPGRLSTSIGLSPAQVDDTLQKLLEAKAKLAGTSPQRAN